MTDDGQRPTGASRDSAVALVRGYVARDTVAVGQALTALNATGQADAYRVLGALFQSTINVVEATGRRLEICRLARLADGLASAAPPHYEFTLTAAVRSWALGDLAEVWRLNAADPVGATHITAVFIAALGLALWDRETFLDVLATYEQITHAPTRAADRIRGPQPPSAASSMPFTGGADGYYTYG
ncbi:hypothetical protein MOV08_02275 [Streptomyces yunnanensis]|uniref:TetR family transcriptional regulator n=1 Tax=Streptomyces yunnanensis TaxID=156453 RepID=A0ABY8A003_9ACTN|nr:hypothetical protein [Streptomyces yunnanensis]WEB38243.1 hypothetical protein MOV08_02275 [Streptomyces yunnanensis]